MSLQSEPQGPTPERFFRAINFYQLSEAIESAIELEVFTAVGEGRSLPIYVVDICCGGRPGGKPAPPLWRRV